MGNDVERDLTIGEPDLAPGTILDSQIQILALIAQGASGSVYRAKHFGLDRLVAVKIMHSYLLDSAEHQLRFKRERAFSGALTHPGVVRTYSAGVTAGGRPYLVMDLVQGRTLAEVLKEGRLPPERFFALFYAIVDALGYLHGEGIVHRDLKPSNVLVEDTDNGERVVLIDFGLSVLAMQDQRLTGTGMLPGTSLYMSPEQCMGARVDQRSDIYGLGCLMLEALTGRPPFEGETPYEVMFKQLHNSLSGLASLRKLPGPIAGVISKCLSKDPEQRFASAGDLKLALEACESTWQEHHDRGRRLRSLMPFFALLCVGVLFLLLRAQPHPTVNFKSSSGTLELAHSPRALKAVLSHARQLRHSGANVQAANETLVWIERNKGQVLSVPECAEVAELAASSARYVEAERYARLGLNLPCSPGEAITLRISLVSALTAMQRLAEARDELMRALKLVPAGNEGLRYIVLTHLANLEIGQCNYTAAARCLKRAIDGIKHEHLWDTVVAFDARVGMIKVHHALNQRALARAMMEDTIRMVLALKEESEIRASLIGLSRVLCQAFYADLAQLMIDKALARRFAASLDLGLRELFDVQFSRGHKVAAIRNTRRLLELQYASGCSPDNIAGTWLLLALMQSREQPGEAMRCVEEVLRMPVSSDFRCRSVRTVITVCKAAAPQHLREFFKSIENTDSSPFYRAQWLCEKAKCLKETGELAPAMSLCDQSLLLLPAQEHFERGSVLAEQASIFGLMKDEEAAISKYKQAIEEWRLQGERSSIVFAFTQMVRLSMSPGQETARYARQGLELSGTQALSRFDLQLLLAQTEPDRAKAIEAARDLMQTAETLDSSTNYSYKLVALRALAQATDSSAKELESIYMQWRTSVKPDAAEMSLLSKLIGLKKTGVGDFEGTRGWFDKALDYTRATHVPAHLCELYRELASVAERYGAREYAQELCKAGTSLPASNEQMARELQLSWRQYAAVLARSGKREEAKHATEEADKLSLRWR